ncbi:MAG: baseplate J/gp47 family protein [Candidatus Competibacteraceae bacterium]
MADKPDSFLLHRDSTSQAQRRQAALDPTYVAVDERSLKDWLAFGQAYAKELRYYNLQNEAAGDWSDCLDFDLDKALAFMAALESVSDEQAKPYRRSHRVLFLAFLQLLQRAQEQLNTLTRRHLEFYYQKMLRLSKKAAQPDRVNVLVEPAEDTAQVLLPAGALLDAGRDSLGKDLVYRTDREIIVNRARIARLSSVYVEKQITGIREAGESYLKNNDYPGALIAMLRIALGDPTPGDPLPFYSDGSVVDYSRLQTLLTRVDVQNTLNLDFQEFRILKQLWEIGETQKDQYKSLLKKAKDKDPQVEDKLKDYIDNFTGVEDFFFMRAEDFVFMMATVEKKQSAISDEWNRIYDALATAYKKKVNDTRRKKLENSSKDLAGFTAMLQLALGEMVTAGGDPIDTLLDKLHNYISEEAYFDFLKQLDVTAQKTDWENVYCILELAWRNREGEPVAQKVEWLNLHPAEEATAIKAPGSGAYPRWHTFGQRQASLNQDNPPATTLGWMLSSPLLLLGQGQRTIILTLAFQLEQFDTPKIVPLLSNSFQIRLSTAKGWLEPTVIKIEKVDITQDPPLPALRFTLTVGENADSLAPLPVTEAAIASPWPMLRLLLQPHWEANEHGTGGRYITPYQLFRNLVLVGVHIQVEVTGLKDLQIQNDDTVLDSRKPFEPFGINPSVGSRFYLGHPELVHKKLDQLKFSIEWMGAPQKMEMQYKNYPQTLNNTSFTTRISLLDKRLDIPLIEKASLFNSADAGDSHIISIPDMAAAIKSGRPGYTYEQDLEPVSDTEVRAWRRYLQWELNAPDFQHGAYPAVVAAKSIELATDIASGKLAADRSSEKPDAADYQVNPPYTPKIKSLSLNYTSSAEILMKDYQIGSVVDRPFHQHPFGYAEVQPDPSTRVYRLLPPYDNEGELYIGLGEVQPPQNLAMLLQMAEGSADPDLEPAPVQWSYLSGNRWISLHDGHILADTTGSLKNAGIIEFQLEPAQPNTLLPPDLYWLRVAIPQHSNSVCDTIAIHTQAVAATFVDRNNAPDHLSQPLPAGSITRLVEPLPAISAIQQRYPSYGGRLPEQDSTFYTRVSERLRHKHRALTLWDYEHLVLEHFPQIYKAKCLPAEEPGRVEIIVIPDVRNQLLFNPFEPKAPASLIAEIKAFLADYTPAFATVQVKNAHYVAIKVRFAVRFLPGHDVGFYKKQLNEELNHFLSPWAYEEGADVVIGGKIYANVIIDFIERRDYVDYVALFRFFKSEDGSTFSPVAPSTSDSDPGYRVETDHPDEVLVAAPQHDIDLIAETHFVEEKFSGINYMKIELDFIIAEGKFSGINHMKIGLDLIVR